jgi:hypothetical protein
VSLDHDPRLGLVGSLDDVAVIGPTNGVGTVIAGRPLHTDGRDGCQAGAVVALAAGLVESALDAGRPRGEERSRGMEASPRIHFRVAPSLMAAASSSCLSDPRAPRPKQSAGPTKRVGHAYRRCCMIAPRPRVGYLTSRSCRHAATCIAAHCAATMSVCNRAQITHFEPVPTPGAV